MLTREDELTKYSSRLYSHKVYNSVNTIEKIRKFMELHVFAVWDFMSLLKSLQKKITCVELPWRPSRKYPGDIVRFINEIVLCEESDLDMDNTHKSHFDIYIAAMQEIGADTTKILNYINILDSNNLPKEVESFVLNNIKIATSDDTLKVASTFLHGREKIIPGMFDTLLKTLDNHNIQATRFKYYLERHIQVDADEHGPLAAKCLNYICGDSPERKLLVKTYAIEAMKSREQLWDNILNAIENCQPQLNTIGDLDLAVTYEN